MKLVGPPRRSAPPAGRRGMLWLAVLALLTSGCDGCRQPPGNAAGDAQSQPVPQADYSIASPRPFPADLTTAGLAVKPGHWTACSQSIKSNAGDRRGVLHSEMNVPKRDLEGRVTVERRGGLIQSRRPVVLPKGQRRQFEFRLLAPLSSPQSQALVNLESRLEVAGQVAAAGVGGSAFEQMPPRQYFFVVLTDRDERFGRWKVADWVAPSASSTSLDPPIRNYRVVIPPDESVLAIPDTLLDWTSTAVLLWDNLKSQRLTPAQLVALDDWLNFGGVLIVNGGDAAEGLSQSPLAERLPWRHRGSRELDATAAAQLLRGWAVTGDRSVDATIALVGDGASRIMSDGSPDPRAAAVADSGELIWQRRIGRGRIVQSRFDLTSDWFSGWESLDSFVNAALLNRPPRRWSVQDDKYGESTVTLRFADHPTAQATAMENTQLRLFARDAVLDLDPGQEPDPDAKAAPGVRPPTPTPTPTRPLYAFDRPSGLAGWNDASDVVSFFRSILGTQSGIDIPSRRLVGQSLAIYLVALLIINFAIFRIAGVVEYAWLAAPLIAILGAVVVARVVRLDIGFARSQTEVSLLEIQPDHRRGHLSRVVAVYNSLSTPYDVRFETPDAAVAPLSASVNRDPTDPATLQTAVDIGPTLTGFSVDSNRVGYLHGEEMVPLGGSIGLRSSAPDGTGVTIRNDSDLSIRGAVLLTADPAGTVRRLDLGDLPAGGSRDASIDDLSRGSPRPDDQDPPDDQDLPDDPGRPADQTLPGANWDEITRRFVGCVRLSPGQVCLIGDLQSRLPGMNLEPAATQLRSHTIVLVQLRHADPPPPVKDVNLISEFRNVQTVLPGDEP